MLKMPIQVHKVWSGDMSETGMWNLQPNNKKV